MKPRSDSERRERQDWLIVLLILLIGFLCVIFAAQWALRFSPSWKLNTDMGSNIDPNSGFLTKPVGFIEPVDSAILTQPAWVSVFLTPGASFVTGTPPPAAAANVVPTGGITAAPITHTVAATNTLAGTSTTAPTNTFVWLPLPATSTRKPPNTSVAPIDTATNAPPPPVLTADLLVTLGSSAAWYAPGTPFTYTITVSNTVPGSSAVNSVTIADTLPIQVSQLSTTWACTGVGTTCTPNGAGNINDVVNLPFGSSVTYTVNVVFNAGVSGSLLNSASVNGGGYVESNPANNIADITTAPGIDLQIMKTGPGSYTAGGPVSYTMDVTNNSPFTLNGVTVTDAFSGQLENIVWNCATCGTSGTGNINDTINMAPNAIVTYVINSSARAEARGPLSNTARVTAPAGFIETNPGNETMDISASGPNQGDINIGPRDGVVSPLGPPFPFTVTMAITPIVVDGNGDYDLVYYEMIASSPSPSGQHIDLDWVQIQISTDGTPGSWYSIFNYGDGSLDLNTNVDIGTVCPGEPDNCGILSTSLYGITGIAINVDAIVPPGVYSWIQITSPASPGGDGSDVDAIEVLP